MASPDSASLGAGQTEEATAVRDPLGPTIPLRELHLSKLRRTLILIVFCLSNFVDVFSFYSALPGLSLMERDLEMSIAKGNWYLAAPALGIACASLVGGRLADIFGAKEVYLVGTLGFIATAIGGALSQSPLQVLLFRGLQGGATGLQIPSGLRGLTQIFPDPAQQRRSLAFFSGGVSLGIAIGPVVGAGLSEMSWRACYWVCVGLGGVVLLLGSWVIPRLPAADEDDRTAVDVFGGLFCLVFGISQASVIHTFRSTAVLVPLCLCVPLIALFFYHETRIPAQRDCLIPPGTWMVPNFVPLMAASSMPYYAWNASTYPVMVYWREVWGWSALGLAAHLLPCGISCLAVTAYATFYEHHFKRHLRLFIVLFLMAGIVASLLASFASTPSRYWVFDFLSLALVPLASVGLQMCCYCGLMQSSPPAMAGVIGALNNVSLQVGVCVFISCGGLIQSSISAKQTQGTNSYEGIAWACRFEMCVAAVVLAVFLGLYRTPAGRTEPVEEGRIVEERESNDAVEEKQDGTVDPPGQTLNSLGPDGAGV